MLGTKVTARRSKRASQNRGDVKESLGNLPHEGRIMGKWDALLKRRRSLEDKSRSKCVRWAKPGQSVASVERERLEFQAAMEGGPSDESQVRELHGKTKQQTAWKRGENHDCRRDSGSVKGAPQNRGRLRSSQSGDVIRSLKAREVVGGVRGLGAGTELSSAELSHHSSDI